MDSNATAKLFAYSTQEQWDAIIRSGMPLVLGRNTWVFVISFLTLLYQLVAVRLFRPYSMALFWFYHEEYQEWYSDQFRVAMANTKTPISALTAPPAYRVLLRYARATRQREKILALFWLFGAIVLTVMPFLVPVLQDRFIPIVQGVPGSSQGCGPILNFTTSIGGSKFDKLLALDMLKKVDLSGYNYNGTTAASVGLNNPKDRINLSRTCPQWAPVCDRANPLTLDIDYWVKRSDFHIGNPNPSEDPEFGVLNTCYLPERHVKFLETNEDGNQFYGMLYGPVNASGYEDVTLAVTPGERFGYGYWMSSYVNSRHRMDPWFPNQTTLDHDGIRTILFYHFSSVSNIAQSDDPLFRTNNTPIGDEGRFLYYKAVNPVICNTTYSFCPAAEDCLRFNGTAAIVDYSDQKGVDSGDMAMAFLELIYFNLWFSPFSFMAAGGEAVLASQTLLEGSTQMAVQDLSAHSELIRLALADRARLVASAERAASGWRKYDPSAVALDGGNLTQELRQQCQWTLVSDPTGRVTTSTRAIIILSIVGGIPLLLTFTGPLWRFLFWRQLFVFTLRWRMRTAAHLHRTTIERGEDDRFWPGGVEDEWPVGKGVVDKVGLVSTGSGYHAIYRPDAELAREPGRRASCLEAVPLRERGEKTGSQSPRTWS
ncbi:hypothetical protein C7999DRAFT_15611 [Corynascus novoguineensis]|uniref:Uncharacterized protein n=1 Tax=Corynascus novoguineensis TaxID=1126955 RepID=A0AAN7HM37_9PEZI|nr:hypothetical protein C7999DRAFT_15611 [Corynascus novoguineensis]